MDENGAPLTASTENDCEEPCPDNGIESASWTGSVADEEEQTVLIESQNGTTKSVAEEEEIAEAAVNSEHYLETALAQQLHVTHVAVPPVPQPYMYPGHYMFGPSLVNVNGSLIIINLIPISSKILPSIRSTDLP